MLTLLVLIQHVTAQLCSKAEECGRQKAQPTLHLLLWIVSVSPALSSLFVAAAAAVAATSVVTAVSDSRCE